MNYIYVLFITILSGINAWLFLQEEFTDRICSGKKQLLESKAESDSEENLDFENNVARWKPSKQIHILITIIISLLAAGSAYQLFSIITDPINIVKVILIMMGVISAGCVDWREQRIPNMITAIMAVLGIGLLILGVVIGQEGAMAYIHSSVFATVVSVVILIILSLLTRHGIGNGDIKLIGAMAIAGGVNMVIGTLFFASILSAVAAMFLVLVKKMNIKSSIPFGPFIMFGCLITIIMMQF